jgi:hypothetical protein
MLCLLKPAKLPSQLVHRLLSRQFDEQWREVMEARDRLLEKSDQPLHAFDDG